MRAKKDSDLMITEDEMRQFREGWWLHSWEKMGAHPLPESVGAAREGATRQSATPATSTKTGQGSHASTDTTAKPTAETVPAAAPASASTGPGQTSPQDCAWQFAVWAPDMESVSVIGDFNGWDPDANPLQPLESSGIWVGRVERAHEGQTYKYLIRTHQGATLQKADPYAFSAECPPRSASVLCDINNCYRWHDGKFLRARKEKDIMNSPLNIYEVHLSSWRRHGHDPQGDPGPNGTYPGPDDPFPAQRGQLYTYRELAHDLIQYVRDMNYTHIELLPVMEHPFDGSWGYQTSCYFAPTARMGSPRDFMALVNAAHAAGIGVILDWVPGGFCSDDYGLAYFNGGMLYECEIHPQWGTHKTHFGRPEVRNFFISNALFWLEMYHADGIRVDGVSSMLYLNFGIDGWEGKKYNRFGGEENPDGVVFLRALNSRIRAMHPDVLMVAEESTAWPAVTVRPGQEFTMELADRMNDDTYHAWSRPDFGNLGFHFKWDMGWMNDTLRYVSEDYFYRKYHHNLLTFSMLYAYTENYIDPLSHDEVVHGKASIIGRMPGDWTSQFRSVRILALYQLGHLGGALNFMGNEFAQYIEWRYFEALEWYLADDFPTHADHQKFIRGLNRFYLDEPAFWEHQNDEYGYQWIDPDNAEQSVISFIRRGNRPEDELLFVINFNNIFHESFRVGVATPGRWELVFKTCDDWYTEEEPYSVESENVPWNYRENSILITLPHLSGLVFKRV